LEHQPLALFNLAWGTAASFCREDPQGIDHRQDQIFRVRVDAIDTLEDVAEDYWRAWKVTGIALMVSFRGFLIGDQVGQLLHVIYPGPVTAINFAVSLPGFVSGTRTGRQRQYQDKSSQLVPSDQKVA
jgi:hypothetical protein